MTTCTPLKPFRCWQYRKDSGEAVPEWVTRFFWMPKPDGWWLVEVEQMNAHWHTPAEFAERFKIVEDGK
jgi:hypothetical protein